VNPNVRGLLVGPSLPGSTPAAVTLLGDLVVVMGFVALGILNHGGAPLESPVYTLERVVPFLLSWAVVAPLAGVYHRETLTRYRQTTALVTPAWVVAALCGSLLRGSTLFPGGAPPAFVLVTLSFGTAMVLVWRLVGVWLRRRFAG
jgi:hypothetical protein